MTAYAATRHRSKVRQSNLLKKARILDRDRIFSNSSVSSEALFNKLAQMVDPEDGVESFSPSGSAHTNTHAHSERERERRAPKHDDCGVCCLWAHRDTMQKFKFKFKPPRSTPGGGTAKKKVPKPPKFAALTSAAALDAAQSGGETASPLSPARVL